MLISNLIQNVITSKAEELGFVKTGFAKAEILEKEAQNLQKWLDLGYDADMKWIKNGFEKRKDINLVMEGAKSVISLAYNYNTPVEHDEAKPKMSRYSWGKDYHKILKSKLRILCNFIENDVFKLESKDNPVRTKYYIDDGPVMDKQWAVRAGIGWQGKNTNIINPELGSWFFLAEIITNIEFQSYNEPIDDMCGSCNICINACPTCALADDYKLDSNLCISYQTIENKGDIPSHLNLAGWFFGCDICQDVCPFNHKEIVTNDIDFYPNQQIFNKSKEELLAISEEEFNAIFADSPVKRTKYSGFRRNIERF